MSEEPTTNPVPESASTAVITETPAARLSTAGTAERYITDELAKAKSSLATSRIVSVAVVLILGGILLYITNGFTSSLEPHAAAEIATGLISDQVSTRGPELVNQLKEKVPELIRQTPDYVLKEMPGYRTQLEDRIEEDLHKYAQSTSDQLGKHLDAVLEAHKEKVKDLANSAKDPTAVAELGPSVKQELMAYIKEAPANGESIMSQIDQSLKALREISAKMKHLAANKGLTDTEKKTRRAVAVLAQAIDEQREALTKSL